MKYTSEDTNLNDFLYCCEELGERPSKVVLAFNFRIQEFTEILDSKETKIVNTLIEIIPAEENIINEKTLIKIDNFFLSFTHIDKAAADGFISNIVILHKIEDAENVDLFIEELNNAISQPESIKTKLNYVSNSQTGLLLEPMEPILAEYDNIDLYHNDSTLKAAKKLINKINKTDKGLSIIYGKRGTGKTTLLHHIAQQTDKEIIFIPLSMIDISINTSAIKSLIGLDTLIIIDDCEILNADMYGKSSLTFANILQMIDGFHSDELLVNILLSFNVEIEDEIDEELIDSNNLIGILKLEELKKSKANELCKHLGIKNKVESSYLLIDILNQSFEETPIHIGYQ